MLTSSRDNWERLVAAVVKRQQIWELCHQPSRSPSIRSTISSDDDNFSEQSSAISVHPSPPFSPKVPSLSQAAYPERFSFRQLQVVTDNFSRRNYLGDVYKGRLADGTLVAIKSLREEWKALKPYTELQFQTEVDMISVTAVHHNLLRLHGSCTNSNERLLVYPYMANGSVASCLRERPPNAPRLDWNIRKRIALGCARGLSYLHDHCDPKIIHRDVKAANILLDEEFEAVVGGFILSKLMDHNVTDVATSVRGTRGHRAPEYLSTGKMTEKTDVFAYGITLLELITARSAFDLARLANDDDLMLLDWVKGKLKEKKLPTLVDPKLKNNYVDEEVEQLIQVALLCTQTSPLGRPKMSEVVRLLDGDGLAENRADPSMRPTNRSIRARKYLKFLGAHFF